MPVTLTVLDNTSSVGEGTPVALSLHGNSPNPFNPLTRISFTLPQAGPARLDVFDVRGRLVSTLWQGELAAGPQAVSWDGRDERGRGVAAGTYFAHLRAGDQKATCKMILAK
jgi:hypothetical protein